MRLSRRPKPFDSEDYLFELKIDGYRALAYVERGQCRLVSRNGNVFRGFKDLVLSIGDHFLTDKAVLDGEIACVDELGRSVFRDLFSRRADCLFFAFDLLFLNDEDWRGQPLIARKARLKKFLGRKRSRILYVDHVETRGRALFEKACALDLEGVVAKRRYSLYRPTVKPSLDWIKIKNARYSQAEGRQEMFEQRALARSAALKV